MRFTPVRPAHSAVAVVPAPHQMRVRRPGECGSIRWSPAPPPNGLIGSRSASPSPSIARRNRSKWSRAMSAPRGSSDPV